MAGPVSLFSDLMSAGGPVMWPLLGLSLLSIALAAERAFFWVGSWSASRRRWFAKTSDALRQGRFDEALRWSAKDASIYARFTAALVRAGGGASGALTANELLRPRVERFSTLLSTIITAAPMLGILGTVLGIISSFKLLGGSAQAAGALQPSDVAAGIAEALYTTAFGLVVALVALFPYVLFRNAIDKALTRFEVLAAAAQEGAEKTVSTQLHSAHTRAADAAPAVPGSARS